MTDKTIETLLRAVADGQTQALAELYRKTDTAVYAYALSILKNAHDAQDVMQTCYIKIFHHAGDYRPNGKPMAWILTIVKNLCLNILRTERKVLPLEETVYLRADTGADDRLLLQACMQELNDEERQIVILHAIAGFKHREIAQYLSMSVSTVLSKYHRAMQKMKRKVLE